MKKYVGTKMIHAEPMTRGEYNQYRGWQIPENENPEDEGYHVLYPDGYESWSPKKQFDEAYRLINHLTFGIAVELLKQGKKVSRRGWNGKMYLFLSPKIGCQMYEQFTGKSINDMREFIVMKTVDDMLIPDDMLVPWVASQTDVLAEDWMLIE